MAQFSWLEQAGISEQVRRAFHIVPLEKMILNEDGTPVIQTTASRLMAKMLCQLDVKPGMRVLEIGTGSGYNAALLRELVGPSGLVVTVEIDPQVASAAQKRLRDHGYADVHCLVGDGWKGYEALAPYDRIIATCKPFSIPDAWVTQLIEEGILSVPLDLRNLPTATVAVYFRKKSNSRLESVDIHQAGFVSISPQPEAIIQPWKRADVVLWSEQEAVVPSLWLHVPNVSSEKRLKLLGALLQEAQLIHLPAPLKETWSFWIYVVATDQTEQLLIAETMEGCGLPSSGFGFFDEDFNIAYLEELSESQYATRSSFLVFGRSTGSRERLLDIYHSWCEQGQPDIDSMVITASRTNESNWTLNFYYKGMLIGKC